MPEKIEASLNWPPSGLAGVPKSPSPAGANGVPGDGTAAGGAPPYDATLAEDMAALSATVRELAGTVAATGAGEPLQAAGDTLQRLGEAADRISHTLGEINAALDERLRGVRADLDFGPNSLADAHPGLTADTEFRGGIPGVNVDPGGARGPGAVTWPPWSPPRKASMWSRVTRSNIAIPLMLVAVILVAAVAYKVVEHVKAQNAAGPVISQGSISSYGSVKVIAGTTCHAGSSTATVQLASAQAKDGTYLVSVAGTMSNGANQSLSNVVVNWGVTYADGYQAVETTTVNAGSDVPGKSTKTFYSLVNNDEGSVPPASISVLHIGAVPTPPACS